MKNISIYILFISLITAACHKEPKTPIPEQELITTMKLTLTDSAPPYSSQTFIFRDIDGDGGSDPTIDSIIIPSGKIYRADLLLLDERNFPPDTSSNEIKDLATAHQFFYQASPVSLFPSISYLDFDTNGKPLGSRFSLNSANTAAIGNLLITLRHEPDKNGLNVSENDITNAGGETDIQVGFPVRLF